MNADKLYKELSEKPDQAENIIEKTITDEIISEKVGQSCEQTGVYDVDIDNENNFIINIYVELSGHGDTEYDEEGEYQDSDGESYGIQESRGRVTIHLSSDNTHWEFEEE